MESIALALKPSSQRHPDLSPDIELHLNIWKKDSWRSWRKTRFFLDLGLKTRCCFDNIFLYLPFSLDDENPWEDLGDSICSHPNLLCAIFNDDLRSVVQDNNCFCKIEKNVPGGNDSFFIYKLGSNNIELITDGYKVGTLLKIKIENCSDVTASPENDFCYIRFRLFIKDASQFAQRRPLSNDLIQAAFSNLDLFDIRINENRNLAPKVKEAIRTGGYEMPGFSKIHIFYIADTRVSVDTASAVKSDSRIIEPEIWKDYEPEPIKLKNGLFIAHHWKAKAEKKQELATRGLFFRNSIPTVMEIPIKSLNLFFTTKYPRIHGMKLASYFSVVVLLGCLGSWIANFGTSDVQTTPEGMSVVDIIRIVLLALSALFIIWALLHPWRIKLHIYRKQS